MKDPYLPVDLLRFVLGIFAVWLAVLILRGGWRRHKEQADHPSMFFYASYALALLLLAALRWQHIGMFPTWDLWVATAVVVLAAIGAFRTWHWTRRSLKPPHARGPH